MESFGEQMRKSNDAQMAIHSERATYQAVNASKKEAANRQMQLTEPSAALTQNVNKGPVPVIFPEGTTLTVKLEGLAQQTNENKVQHAQAIFGSSQSAK